MTESHFGRPENPADRQLADARRDPRLAHGREAVVADWWAAMGAAERVRTLADWGIHELVDSEVREEGRVDASGHTDPAGPRRQAASEAARQRGELARAEWDNQLVEHNAMTLISMVGALDALVEELVPRARKMLVEHRSRSLVDRGATELRRLTLPDDPIPLADAIVGVGHALNYLDDESQVDAALVAIATSLRSGGIMAIDLCDLEWGTLRVSQPPRVWRTDDWVLITEVSVPDPNRFVRIMTTFVRQDDGTWRRDDERHDNVLIDTSKVPPLLAHHGVEATLSASFGDEPLSAGLVTVVGRKAG